VEAKPVTIVVGSVPRVTNRAPCSLQFSLEECQRTRGHLAIQCTTGMRFADGLLQRSGYCQDGGRWPEDIILGPQLPRRRSGWLPVQVDLG
jgi:hypothetical protein